MRDEDIDYSDISPIREIPPDAIRGQELQVLPRTDGLPNRRAARLFLRHRHAKRCLLEFIGHGCTRINPSALKSVFIRLHPWLTLGDPAQRILESDLFDWRKLRRFRHFHVAHARIAGLLRPRPETYIHRDTIDAEPKFIPETG